MCSLIFLFQLVGRLSLQSCPCDCRHTLSPVKKKPKKTTKTKPVGCFQEEISAHPTDVHTSVLPTLLLTAAKGDAARTPTAKPAAGSRAEVFPLELAEAAPGSHPEMRRHTERHRQGHAPPYLGRRLSKKERRSYLQYDVTALLKKPSTTWNVLLLFSWFGRLWKLCY